MRVHKHFAQGELSDKQKINLKSRSINKDREVKKALT